MGTKNSKKNDCWIGILINSQMIPILNISVKWSRISGSSIQVFWSVPQEIFLLLKNSGDFTKLSNTRLLAIFKIAKCVSFVFVWWYWKISHFIAHHKSEIHLFDYPHVVGNKIRWNSSVKKFLFLNLAYLWSIMAN